MLLVVKGVHGLGQPRKPSQTHPKIIIFGLGNWVGMISKNGKPIKINGFRIKPNPDPKNPSTQ